MIPPHPFAAHGVGVARRRGAPAGAEAATCGRYTPLHYATYWGNVDATCALLIAGATVGIKNNDGYGARVWARASRGATHRPMRRAA